MEARPLGTLSGKFGRAETERGDVRKKSRKRRGRWWYILGREDDVNCDVDVDDVGDDDNVRDGDGTKVCRRWWGRCCR